LGYYKSWRRSAKSLTAWNYPHTFAAVPVISIEHLEPAVPDPYNRKLALVPPLKISEGNHDDVPRYTVDHTIKKVLRRLPGGRKKAWYYRVRCQGYNANDAKDDSWIYED
jgi:hypothetical protein